jgi:serine/threonine protein kinase
MATSSMASTDLPEALGHYRVTHLIGAGGMGRVVAARDERLGRPVALKLLRHDAVEGEGGRRLWREARAAAAVRHPAICQIYDVGEQDGHIFIAMELVEGETLTSRLARGPMPVGEAIDLSLALLDALSAIHGAGLLHRDVKPANLMLTPHGLKVLDFGLARPPAGLGVADETLARADVTMAGMLVGTVAYIAPEVISGGAGDQRSDLFAAGAVLFEMLAAQPAFRGATAIAVAHGVLHEHPPALTGAPAVGAVDRVIRRALAKDPAQRFDSAQAFAAALRAIQRPDASGGVTARAVQRLIVLPFRALRADEDTDFLCASLPESVAATLSALDSIVVRSSLVAARFGPSPDVQTLAAEADMALTGTLFRAHDDIRVSAQLVDVPTGTLVQSCAFQHPARNLIDLHDGIVAHLVDSLRVHLSAREDARLRRDVPASQTAYELFLRANERARDRGRTAEALDLYGESLAADPGYAPAWAQLGRLHRLRAKYDRSDTAESLRQAREALDRALALNPDLDVAHGYYAQLEADVGEPRRAMVRLLGRAAVRQASAEISAGLVYACRFCGLTSESIAFHHDARRLDPGIASSVTQTYFQAGDYLRSLETAGEDVGYIGPCALDAMGRRADAVARLRARVEQGPLPRGARLLIESLLASLEGRRDACMALVQQFCDEGFVGAEAQAYLARQLIHVGACDEGLVRLDEAVRLGFSHVAWFERDPWFDPVRDRQAFGDVLARARGARAEAVVAFEAAGGDTLLARAKDRTPAY